MNDNTLMKKLKRQDLWVMQDAVQMLTNHHSGNGTSDEIMQILESSVKGGSIVPTASAFNYTVSFAEQDYKFRPKEFLQWARGKDYKIPKIFGKPADQMPAASQDYSSYWGKLAEWSIMEAVLLLCDLDPRWVNSKDAYIKKNKETLEIYEMLIRENKADRLYKLDPQYEDDVFMNASPLQYSPITYIRFAKEKKVPVPPELEKAVERFTSKLPKSERQANIQPEKKTRKSSIHKAQCQAVAKTLWDMHPDMTIEQMKKQKPIQEYAGGKFYAGKNTVRGWLSEVDPRSPEQKRGRPPSK